MENIPVKPTLSIKRVEFRRHGRRGSGKGLSEQGFHMAESHGRTLTPPYNLIITSPKRRCIETAQAFGFIHYLEDERFGPPDLSQVEAHEKKIKRIRKRQKGMSWIEAAMRLPESRHVLQRIGQAAMKSIQAVLHFLPSGGKAIVVTHGDLMEAVALMGCDRYEWERLGSPFGHCEGFELELTGGRITGMRQLRIEGAPKKNKTVLATSS